MTSEPATAEGNMIPPAGAWQNSGAGITKAQEPGTGNARGCKVLGRVGDRIVLLNPGQGSRMVMSGL